MPPRRLSVGNRRRDAAFDAMRLYGFSDDLIRGTLNELLKVYGREGWIFIEENSYRVLTEAILAIDNQSNQEQDNQPVQNNLLDEQQQQQQQEAVVQQVPEQLEFVQQDQVETESEPPLPEVDSQENYVQEITQHEHPVTKNFARGNSLALEEQSNLELLAHCALDTTPPSEAPCRIRRSRKPCYGWISDDDDEDDEEKDDDDDFVISVRGNQ